MMVGTVVNVYLVFSGAPSLTSFVYKSSRGHRRAASQGAAPRHPPGAVPRFSRAASCWWCSLADGSATEREAECQIGEPVAEV